MVGAHFRRKITDLVSNCYSPLVKPDVYFSFSLRYFSTFSEIKSSNTQTFVEFLVHRHHFSPEVASFVDSALSSRPKRPEKCDSTISFLKECGFTNLHLEKTFKGRPTLLLANVEKIIKPKITILQDIGFSDKVIADIISKEPSILHTSAKNIVLPRLSLLRDLLGSNVEVGKALRISGRFLRADLEKNLIPNIEYLNSCGISMEQIRACIKRLPRIFMYKPEVMRRCVDKVDQLGVDRSSKRFMYAVGVVGAMAKGMTWELKMQAFRDNLGFSDDDILRVLKQNPRVFLVSEDKMKKVKEVLLATGKYKLSCIVVEPESLAFSVEKRYKPRFEVLNIVESRHLIKKWPSLGELCRLSDANFSKKFVHPYLHDPALCNWYEEKLSIKD